MATPERPSNVWRLITHHERQEELLRWAVERGRLAVGWGLIGDIRQHGFGSAEEIASAIRDQYPDLDNAHLGGPSLYHFCYGVRSRDLVILSTGRRRARVVEVTGAYRYDHENDDELIDDYQHQRTAVATPIDADVLWRTAGGLAEGHNIRWTFVGCARSIDATTRAALSR